MQNLLACGITQKYGTDQQKEEWLAAGPRRKLGCFCSTEPHTGSDAGAITTKADRVTATASVLNGVKQFITTGKHAHMAIVFAAVTDKAAGKKGIKVCAHRYPRLHRWPH